MITQQPRDTLLHTLASREYWRDVLLGGASGALPRWTRESRPGIGEYEATLPEPLTEALQRRADEMGVSVRSILLAAHARVLGALSGDREVVTGFVTAAGRAPLPCRLPTEPGSWRELIREAERARCELLAHAEFPVEALGRELGLTLSPFETLFDASLAGDELPQDVILRVNFEERGQSALRLRHRTDALDAEAARRIAGYHLAALTWVVDEPDAEPTRHSLLSEEERSFQCNGLAGPQRDLPGLRVHELFEAQVRARPDAIAAVHGESQWTYAELNARANRLAQALLGRGLPGEGIVAVVTERNLEWLCSVLAIFKAGGAYLPIEPHFPADRIVRMITRAGCRLVLTERPSRARLDESRASLPGVQVIALETVYEESEATDDLGIPVAADQLAYIYFTSGSTGEPKGVMCEHAGMLNHLLAKIHDLEIGEGTVVAQVAPQCFDISLWQLLAALLVGGRTLIIEQGVILDAGRFVERVADGRVGVLQVVPSYLEVLLTFLEIHPRELPDLEFVSVTGEALKRVLVQRWFALQPALRRMDKGPIRLVNAYGLTETSDDTNHEIMDRVPERDRVPLGRPIPNARVHLVDETLALVPLGAPGEIVFTGVCVGRGYINDPERTQRAFVPDPFREGPRLYRSGDFGRWLPDGRLEFLGRRDAQVKVSGFRIELGEVERALLKLPGVRDGAVVVAGQANHRPRLVAFYSARLPLTNDLLKSRLGSSLPDYMVPSAFHWRDQLPLTGNGKIDKKALVADAEQLELREPVGDTPVSATEQRVAAAWAQVLGVPQPSIGRSAGFFDLGGTSLSAVKVVIALGRAITIADLAQHPTLADLAVLIDRRAPSQRNGHPA